MGKNTEQNSYLKAINNIEKNKIKYAGIDIGENNLMAVFVDDETTKSLLVDGKPFKDYDKMVNEIIDYLNELKSKEMLDCKTSKTETNYTVKNTDKSKNIDRLINFLHTNRRKFLHERFNIMSRYVIEYLHLHGVTDLFISNRLANHTFLKIPFKILLQCIKYNAQEYGITVHDDIDERYTSKASCISDDVKSAQKNPKLADTFNGKRKGDSFHDKAINKRFNADLNAAVNHIIVGTGKSFAWLKEKMFKLCNPIKIKSENKFRKLLDELKSSKEGKTNET